VVSTAVARSAGRKKQVVNTIAIGGWFMRARPHYKIFHCNKPNAALRKTVKP